MKTGKSGYQKTEEKHSECREWGESSNVMCIEDDRETTQRNITCLAKGRVKIPIPSKSLYALFGTFDRVESNK